MYVRPKKQQMSMETRKENLKFPALPDGYIVKNNSREITPVKDEYPDVEIDDFMIKNEAEEGDDKEEFLLFHVQYQSSIAEYMDKFASCQVCNSTFGGLNEAVSHIHQMHGIRGGSQHFYVDASRLLEAGYLKIDIMNPSNGDRAGSRIKETEKK